MTNKYRQYNANHGLIISQSNYTAIIAPIMSEGGHLKERIHMSWLKLYIRWFNEEML